MWDNFCKDLCTEKENITEEMTNNFKERFSIIKNKEREKFKHNTVSTKDNFKMDN
jgi:hypothetical protein